MPESSQSKSGLTVGELRRLIAYEPDDCPVRIVVYTDQGGVRGYADRANGGWASVGAVNIIADKTGRKSGSKVPPVKRKARNRRKK